MRAAHRQELWQFPRSVRFAFRDYAAGGRTRFATLGVLAFIGRLIRHIPDSRAAGETGPELAEGQRSGHHFPMVRHAGLFANRWRARHLAQARQALRQPEPAPPAPAAGWASRQQRLSGADPLCCPHCQVPLVLVAVVFCPWDELQARTHVSGRLLPVPLALRKAPD